MEGTLMKKFNYLEFILLLLQLDLLLDDFDIEYLVVKRTTKK
jgi:hypothetical protein